MHLTAADLWRLPEGATAVRAWSWRAPGAGRDLEQVDARRGLVGETW